MEYADIFNGLFCNVASASMMIPVQDRIKNYFSKNPDATSTDIGDTTAIPLAIGYYFNMLDKIEDLLKGDNLVLKEHRFLSGEEALERMNIQNGESDLINQLAGVKLQETKTLGRFDYKDIKLKIIYPKELTNRNLNECSFYLNEQTQRASLESVTAGRPYGVNFIPDDETLSGITIVDYARPIEVIYKYFNEFKGYTDLQLKDNQWEERVEEEMQAFLGTLKFLIDEKSTFLYRVTCTEAI